MAESPGSQLGLGIEAVEWLPAGEMSATVMITGRWRRRPSWQGRPVLVIEAEGRRHRFPAIPDPPSLAGAAPGTWRISFSIPAWLAPRLGGRAWLQLGVVLVPLPPVVERQDPGLAPEDVAKPLPAEADSTETPSPGPEVSDSPSGPPSGEEPQTADMLAAAAELTARITQLDAERRAAAARAEAEEGRSAELERQLAESRLHAERSERLAREAEFERERLLDTPEAMRKPSWREQLPAELELARRAPPARDGARRSRVRDDLYRRAVDQLSREQEAARAGELFHWRGRTAELERQLRESALRAEQLYEVIEDLRSVLDVIRGVPSDRSGAPAAAGPEAPTGGAPTADTPGPSQGPGEVEPARLDTALTKLRETIPPAETEEVAEGADSAAEETGAAPGTAEPSEEPGAETRPSEPGPEAKTPEPGPEAKTPEPGPEAKTPEPGPEAKTPEPRPEAKPPEPEPEAKPPEPGPAQQRPEPLPAPASPTRKSWLLRTLRALAKDDPAAAGRVALGLLPAQRLASEQPLTYDLLLSDAGVFRVTADEAGAEVVRQQQRRDPAELDFALTGDLATFARLLVAGPIRRRLERGVAELSGSRKALAAVLALIRTPFGLRELHTAGARLEPLLAFTLIAWMIEPRWTAGHRFTIAHRGPEGSVYLRVPGGSRPSVGTSPPLGPVAATVVCEPDELLAVLAADGLSRATIRGRAEVLELLRGWAAQAQGS